MKHTIKSVSIAMQSIFDELSILESLVILLKNYCLNNDLDPLLLSDKQKKELSYKKCNFINVTDLAITTIEKIKSNSDDLEESIFFLNQYSNDSSRQVTT